MLFALKRSAPAALLAAVVLGAGAGLAADWLGLGWTFGPTARTLAVGAATAAGMLLADGLVHAALRWRHGAAYEAVYGRIVRYFRGQSPVAIAAGGALAAAEEVAFRGVVLLGLVRVAGTPPALAVVAAALAFGALHVTPGADLGPFALWAVWEGLALGAVFVATGSLPGVAIAHAFHDIVGFATFARQRRSGT